MRASAGTILTTAIAAALWAIPLAHAQAPPTPAYKNLALPFDKRAADLVSRMTLDEKASQMAMLCPAIPHLDIPACAWWSEGAHGMGRAGRATIFPDPIMMAAAWDPALLKNVAVATADEARAKFIPEGARYYGIMIWSPTINMARDPRWGRTEETYSEDVCLTSRLGVAFCQGIQGDDPKYLKAIATPKHFIMNNQEAGRTSLSFPISERMMREYYLPAWEACFHEGGALSVMAAHNGINGVPCTANQWLLTDLLRGEWGFQGAVVTDYWATRYLVNSHHYKNNYTEAVAAVVNAGVDVLSDDGAVPVSGVKAAVAAGMLKEATVDQALIRGFTVRMKLGMFDPPALVPFTKTPKTVVGSKEHLDLSLQMAREGIVLLKNDPAPKGYGFDKLLPLDLRRIGSIAVVGPYAMGGAFSESPQGPSAVNGTSNLVGTYTGTPAGVILAPDKALEAAIGERIIIRTALAGDPDAAVAAAAKSDLAIVVVGLNNHIENEGVDRASLELPIDQQRLVERIVKVNPLTIVVLEGGSAIGCAWLKEHVPAILMLWYPGEQGAVALADTLLGKNNPSGKLPLTFYNSAADLPPISDYELDHGRTYMYVKKPVGYVFGYGLSYTTFTYANLRQMPAPAGAGTPVPTTVEPAFTFSVDITNTGPVDGDEVVQLYVSKPQSAVPRPIRQLRDFARVSVPRGATKTVQFKVPVKDLAYWDVGAHKFVVEPGVYHVEVGASSGDLRLTTDVTVK